MFLNPNRLLEVIKPFVVLLGGVFILVFLYGLMREDEYEDSEFTVTITYDCNRVLTERNYPSEVLGECLDLKKELDEQRR